MSACAANFVTSDVLPLLTSGIYSPACGQGRRWQSSQLPCTCPTWIERWLYLSGAGVLV